MSALGMGQLGGSCTTVPSYLTGLCSVINEVAASKNPSVSSWATKLGTAFVWLLRADREINTGDYVKGRQALEDVMTSRTVVELGGQGESLLYATYRYFLNADKALKQKVEVRQSAARALAVAEAERAQARAAAEAARARTATAAAVRVAAAPAPSGDDFIAQAAAARATASKVRQSAGWLKSSARISVSDEGVSLTERQKDSLFALSVGNALAAGGRGSTAQIAGYILAGLGATAILVLAIRGIGGPKK